MRYCQIWHNEHAGGGRVSSPCPCPVKTISTVHPWPRRCWMRHVAPRPAVHGVVARTSTVSGFVARTSAVRRSMAQTSAVRGFVARTRALASPSALPRPDSASWLRLCHCSLAQTAPRGSASAVAPSPGQRPVWRPCPLPPWPNVPGRTVWRPCPLLPRSDTPRHIAWRLVRYSLPWTC